MNDLNVSKLPSNRGFGYFFSMIFLLLFVFFFYKSKLELSIFFAILTTIFFLITSFKDNLLAPLNLLWFKLGTLLGMIVSPIILGLIFFGFFTPIGMVMKIFGRDELGLKIKQEKSHWIVRRDTNDFSDQFKKQF